MRMLLGAAITVLVSCSASAELPDELQHLETIKDEPAAVDAMRNFHTLQEGLIRWDSELAAQYVDSGERSLAETKAEDVRRRVRAVGSGWQYLLARYPSNPRVNNYYGEYLYDHTRDQAAAVQHWQRAVDLDPAFAPGFNNLGVHYLHNGNVRLGLQYLNTAVELDPNHPDYLFNITQAYLNYRRHVNRLYAINEKKVYEQAMDFSRRAAEYAPNDLQIVQDYAVNFYAAENFGLTADWKAAAQAWDDVLAIAVKTTDRYYAILNKARVMIRMRNWSEAIALLEQSLEMEPDSEVAASLLEQCRAELDRGSSKKRKSQ